VSERAFGRIMAAPAVLLLLAVGVLPFLYMLYAAFHTFPPNPTVPPKFGGLANFSALARDPQFVTAVRTTIIVAAAALTLQMVLGFILALALNRITRFRGPVLSLLLIPSAIAPVVAGIVWWMLFNTRYGAVNAMLGWFGVEPIAWTVTMPYALITIVVAAVWQWTPFVAVILLGGLSTVPVSVSEAACIDGASGWPLFRHVTLPLLRPFILVAGLMMLIELSRLYEVPFYITQGGPGSETVVGGVFMAKLAFDYFDLGRASMMSLLYVVTLSVIAALFMRVVNAREIQDA
jgi:multiple sugar transport system permease protein